MVAVVLWQMLISTTISQNPGGYGRGMTRHTGVWMYYYMQKAVIMTVCPRIRLHDATHGRMDVLLHAKGRDHDRMSSHTLARRMQSRTLHVRRVF